MNDLPSAGFHYGVPFDTYRAWPAANISTLKPIRRSGAHCRWQMDHPRESDECNVGSALHVSLLEPARFREQFFIAPEYDGRTKEGKEIAARVQEQAAGRTVIRRKAGDAVDADDIAGMTESVWQHRGAAKLLRMAGQCEVSLLWQDPATGIMCKARFDKLIAASPRPIILEIKTTRDARSWSFGKDCHTLGYADQAAYYCWGHEVIAKVAPLHVILAIENKGPWCAKLHCLDDAALQTGAREFRECLDIYAECQKSGRWPGYDEAIATLSLPMWANKDND